MKNILVIGAGMVGSAIAIDLGLSGHKITLIDININTLFKVDELFNERSNIEQKKVQQIQLQSLDISDSKKLSESINLYNPDIVISAVPGFLGFETLKTIIECGKNVVDISFSPEDAHELNELAINKGVTAIVDCGVAPGLDNIILGHHNSDMVITNFECLVGGLPKIKKWPFNYKAPFSPIDVIEEYTRPARYVENGKMITKEALSDCDLVDFESLGTLESFNSDGLRSLIFTMPHIQNMKEKTLRYPGHTEFIKVLKASGFFSKDQMSVNGNLISPLDFTCSVLFKEWKLQPNEEELTIMRVTIEGHDSKTGDQKYFEYNLYDEYCKETKTSSMARTTGYTATAAVELVLNNVFDKEGVFPPELVGAHPKCFDYIINYLKERNVNLKIS